MVCAPRGLHIVCVCAPYPVYYEYMRINLYTACKSVFGVFIILKHRKAHLVRKFITSARPNAVISHLIFVKTFSFVYQICATNYRYFNYHHWSEHDSIFFPDWLRVFIVYYGYETLSILFCVDDCQPVSFSVSNSYPVQIHVHIVAKIDRLRKSRSIVSSVSIARDGLSRRLLCIVFLDGMIDRVWVSFIGSRAKPTLTWCVLKTFELFISHMYLVPTPKRCEYNITIGGFVLSNIVNIQCQTE